MASAEELTFSSLRDSGVFLLIGEINEESCRDVVSWILEMNLSIGKKHNHSILTLVLNSEGGELASGFAIIDTMRGSNIPVHTVGLGQICSAAFMIFMAGAHRVLTPNTSIMSHAYSWGIAGKHHELVSVQDEMQLMYDRMIRHYNECTGLDDAKIKKHLLKSTDTWLSCEDALKFNICDEVKLIKPLIRSVT